MDFRGKKVTILGLAREGLDLAGFLCQQGAQVRISDRKSETALAAAIDALGGYPIAYSLGGHPPEEVLDAAVLFVSPGVPQESPVLQEARRRGLRVSSATQLLLELAPCPVVGITGSSGKTTTTSLVGDMLRAGGRHVLVGGNIGVPLLNRLGELTPESWLVLELSSFQLETVDRSPHTAAITNLTPNHLDRHETMEAYAAAKERIFLFQGSQDWTILNADDPGSQHYCPPARVLRFALSEERLAGADGAFLRDEALVVRASAREEIVCLTTDVRLRGRHNLANVLTACAVAAATGLPVAAMRQVAVRFTGVAHRLQVVAEHGGVRFVDDSIATSPERSIAALHSYDEPIILIAGGRDKHLPMEEWAQVIVERVHHLVLLGEMSGLVERAVRQADPEYTAISRAADVDDAVARSANVARPGDVVLLSPGGTSFDMFADFEARGDAFAQAARRLLRRERSTASAAQAEN